MRLNEGKCKVLLINVNNDSPPLIRLSNKPLEIVSSYKYLGIEINTELNSTEQWHRTQKRIGPVPYLLKQLKLNGFREEILVTVYRSHVLSHIGYGSPIFISATAAIHDEMERAQSRAFSIIGISEKDALEKYSIGTVKQFIEHTCVNTIKRMLTNPEHKLAEKLAFDPVRETRGAFRFRLPVARTEAYNNSIVPRCVRVLRDGEAALYNPFAKKMKEAAKRRRDMALRKSGKAVVKQQAACRHCGKLCEASRGVKIHESRCKSAPPPTKTKRRATPPS